MTVSVLAVGDLTLDIILGPIEELPRWGREGEVAGFESRLGGNLGNFAVAAQALGLEIVCAGPIGDDESGARVVKELEAIGCGTALVDRMAGEATCISIGFVRNDGERLFVTYPGALHRLGDFLQKTEPPTTDVAFLSGWCQPPRIGGDILARFLAALSVRKTRTVMDLSWSMESWKRSEELIGALRHVDFVLLNHDELAAVTGHPDVGQGLAAITAALGERPAVIVKRGREGAAAKRGNGLIVEATAPPVEHGSAVGAGDTFNAAFIAATFERGFGLPEAIAFACDFASCMMVRGRPGSGLDAGSRSGRGSRSGG